MKAKYFNSLAMANLKDCSRILLGLLNRCGNPTPLVRAVIAGLSQGFRPGPMMRAAKKKPMKGRYK
jgi:hypothetical protein